MRLKQVCAALPLAVILVHMFHSLLDSHAHVTTQQLRELEKQAAELKQLIPVLQQLIPSTTALPSTKNAASLHWMSVK